MDEITLKRKAKESLDVLFPFLTCSINKHSAKYYVDTLVKHNMLYFFEDDANDVVVFETKSNGQEYSHSFTPKQATILNVIRNRFRNDETSFQAMFDAVFCSDNKCMITDEERAANYLQNELEVVNKLMG